MAASKTEPEKVADAVVDAAVDVLAPAEAAIIDPPAEYAAERIVDGIGLEAQELLNSIRAHWGHHEDVAAAIAAGIHPHQIHELVLDRIAAAQEASK